jgi:ABC-2 type transport system ATP-binding protein
MAEEKPVILAEGLKKSFGKVPALKGVDLGVPAATVMGLLGPNGAGKTTAVRILTTLLLPDEGHAEVAGFDVTREPARVRESIGLAGQSAAVDEVLSGHENLEMVGRLYHLGRAEAQRRAEELLERFDLAEAGHRSVKGYSGGMRRRLDLAASLVGRPPVLFLDEPTSGLDPRSRIELWNVIKGLVADGTTLLLTTQYLEEADSLANHIALIDRGLVIAEGTADELKRKIGGDVLAFRVPDRSAIATAAGVVVGLDRGGAQVDNESGEVTLPVGEDGSALLVEAVRRLDGAGVHIEDLSLRRPTLDDVFLSLTGHAAEDGAAPPDDGARRPRREEVVR